MDITEKVDEQFEALNKTLKKFSETLDEFLICAFEIQTNFYA